jgi:hemerythrin superfamily protein
MKSTAILDLMVKDHARLVGLLNTVETNVEKERKTLIEAVDKFNWHLEKHIFTEEKAIFTQYSPTDVTEGYAMVPTLIKEHNVILNKMDLLRKDIMKQRPIDFYAFKELLINHKNFEEEKVYPQLDQELDEIQKQRIVDRIKEIM